MRSWAWPWSGVFGGGAFWYLAHDLSTYVAGYNCGHPWLTPLVHVVCLAGTVCAGWLSYRAWPDVDTDARHIRIFASRLGVAAAALFALVILWQGIAAVIYSGCER